MTTDNNDNRYVLSCIDGSSFSEAVCEYSSWIAKTISAPLKFLHTIEHEKAPAASDLTGAIGLGASSDLLDELTEVEQARSRLLIKKGKLMLEAAQQKAEAAAVSDIEVIQQHGSLTEALVEMEQDIRILVVGIRGEAHEQTQAGLGAQLETVVRSLHRPILVVNREFKQPQKIMLAYNDSDAAKKALAMVARSPLFKAVPCHLVHVGEADSATTTMMETAAQQLRDAGIAVEVAVLSGKLEEVLSVYQADNDIDLTLMGAFSHNRIRDFLLGSFTAKMLERTQKPLLLLR